MNIDKQTNFKDCCRFIFPDAQKHYTAEEFTRKMLLAEVFQVY